MAQPRKATFLLFLFLFTFFSFEIKKINAQNTPSKILSKNYFEAIHSVKKGIVNKDRKSLKLGLKSSFFDVRIKSVEALSDLEGSDFTEVLVDMLRNNQIPQRSTELNEKRKELDKVLISSIEN